MDGALSRLPDPDAPLLREELSAEVLPEPPGCGEESRFPEEGALSVTGLGGRVLLHPLHQLRIQLGVARLGAVDGVCHGRRNLKDTNP
jgi:hypothetical protein